jgi:ribosomal protein S18 acetylase RimI-like enzyme
MQFQAQDRHYREQYPQADFYVIERAGAPVGRLYLDRGPDQLRVIDISLVTAQRDQGIGTTLLRDLQAEAQRDGRRVVLSVAIDNRARSLYRRLGFVESDSHGMHIGMRWPAGAVAAQTQGECQ